MPRTILALVLAGAAASSANAQLATESVATYRVTFDATWSRSTHPVEFPSSAHFSGLVGGTHDDTIAFWEVGALATPGIKSMAETGSKSLLLGEVNAAISAGSAFETVSGPGVGVSPGSASVTFRADAAHPLATIVSMIAPSPDWFVGTHGLALRDAAGWIARVVVDLPPYDAGTDSGPTFTSPNQPTVPPEPIRSIADEHPFTGTPPMGTFTFELLDVFCAYADCDASGSLDLFDFLCFQNAFAAGDPYADCDASGSLDFFDFLCFQNVFAGGCS